MSTDVKGHVEINESTNQKNYVISGVFSTPDKKNKNGRIYSSAIWQENVIRYQKEIENNTNNTLMELEHPPRTTVNPWEAVAKIRKLEMKDGYVYGEAVILNNNDKKTNQLKALIDAGVKIGVSTRGTGKMKGDIVEAYNLITVDIVANPSNYESNLEGFNESFILENVNIEPDGKGGWICTEEGCKINETDTKINKKSEKNDCKKNVNTIIEALKKYGNKIDYNSNKSTWEDAYKATDELYKFLSKKYKCKKKAVNGFSVKIGNSVADITFDPDYDYRFNENASKIEEEYLKEKFRETFKKDYTDFIISSLEKKVNRLKNLMFEINEIFEQTDLDYIIDETENNFIIEEDKKETLKNLLKSDNLNIKNIEKLVMLLISIGNDEDWKVFIKKYNKKTKGVKDHIAEDVIDSIINILEKKLSKKDDINKENYVFI